jgi:hypothetical protein
LLRVVDLGPVKEHVFDDLYEHFKNPDAWETFPEVEATLQALKSMNIRIGVISNFDERLVRFFPPVFLSPTLSRPDVQSPSLEARDIKKEKFKSLFRFRFIIVGVRHREA